MTLLTAAGLHDFHAGSNGMGGYHTARRSLTNLSELGAEKSPESANRFRAPPESLEAQLSQKLQACCMQTLKRGNFNGLDGLSIGITAKCQCRGKQMLGNLPAARSTKSRACRIRALLKPTMQLYLLSRSSCEHPYAGQDSATCMRIEHGSCAGVC